MCFSSPFRHSQQGFLYVPSERLKHVCGCIIAYAFFDAISDLMPFGFAAVADSESDGLVVFRLLDALTAQASTRATTTLTNFILYIVTVSNEDIGMT